MAPSMGVSGKDQIHYSATMDLWDLLTKHFMILFIVMYKHDTI